MFESLFPKQDGFFDLFDQLASRAVESTTVFVELLEDFGELPTKVQRLREIEHEGDEVMHQAMKMLHTAFVAPMDRRQIYSLVSHIDDVIDLTEVTGRRMMMYDTPTPTSELREMAGVLKRATLEIQKAVGLLRNLQQAQEIKKHCIEVNRLENEGDQLRNAVIGRLFGEEKDPIQVMKWKEIYEDVETAIDRCEDVANVIEGVVLENA